MTYKIGIGYDIHRLEEGRKLFLGGVEIPYVKGLLGHSDADVLLHAVCDALLGAAGGGDIGELFPDTDPKYSGISSRALLKEIVSLIQAKGFRVGNLDTVVITEEPKLAPFKKQIRESISAALGLHVEQVNVKAKTNEGLDEAGKGNAIASYAVVVLEKET